MVIPSCYILTCFHLHSDFRKTTTFPKDRSKMMASGRNEIGMPVNGPMPSWDMEAIFEKSKHDPGGPGPFSVPHDFDNGWEPRYISFWLIVRSSRRLIGPALPAWGKELSGYSIFTRGVLNSFPAAPPISYVMPPITPDKIDFNETLGTCSRGSLRGKKNRDSRWSRRLEWPRSSCPIFLDTIWLSSSWSFEDFSAACSTAGPSRNYVLPRDWSNFELEQVPRVEQPVLVLYCPLEREFPRVDEFLTGWRKLEPSPSGQSRLNRP